MKKALTILMILTTMTILSVASAGTRIVVRNHYRAPVVHKTVIVKPATGLIDINCNRDQATVYVNGKAVGKAGALDGSPSKLRLKPGTYNIKVKHGFRTYKTKAVVRAGKELNLKVVL